MLKLPGIAQPNVRYASEALAKFNLSFSPGFSLGLQRTLNFGNRFNGFRRCAESSMFPCKPLKRFSVFKRALTPG